MSPRGPRGGFSSVLLRVLPWDSPLRRAWAGTKLISLVLLTGVLLYVATWWAAAAGAVLVALSVRAGRVPRTAWPSLPPWMWTMLLGGAVGAWLGGGIEYYLLSCALSAVVLAASLVATWTTPMEEIAPAVATLLGPLRALRLPVDEWALAVGLTVRALPALMAELGVVADAARLRPQRRGRAGARDRLRLMGRSLMDAVVAVLATSARRGADTGTAMVARGGPSPLPRHPVRFRGVDAAILAVTVALLAVPVLAVAVPGLLPRW